jgi:hypothetical protein
VIAPERRERRVVRFDATVLWLVRSGDGDLFGQTAARTPARSSTRPPSKEWSRVGVPPPLGTARVPGAVSDHLRVRALPIPRGRHSALLRRYLFVAPTGISHITKIFSRLLCPLSRPWRIDQDNPQSPLRRVLAVDFRGLTRIHRMERVWRRPELLTEKGDAVTATLAGVQPAGGGAVLPARYPVHHAAH